MIVDAVVEDVMVEAVFWFAFRLNQNLGFRESWTLTMLLFELRGLSTWTVNQHQHRIQLRFQGHPTANAFDLYSYLYSYSCSCVALLA